MKVEGYLVINSKSWRWICLSYLRVQSVEPLSEWLNWAGRERERVFQNVVGEQSRVRRHDELRLGAAAIWVSIVIGAQTAQWSLTTLWESLIAAFCDFLDGSKSLSFYSTYGWNTLKVWTSSRILEQGSAVHILFEIWTFLCECSYLWASSCVEVWVVPYNPTSSMMDAFLNVQIPRISVVPANESSLCLKYEAKRICGKALTWSATRGTLTTEQIQITCVFKYQRFFFCSSCCTPQPDYTWRKKYFRDSEVFLAVRYHGVELFDSFCKNSRKKREEGLTMSCWQPMVEWFQQNQNQ